MAQGLDLKSWNGEKSPATDGKSVDTVKRTRGIGSRRIFPPQFKLQVLDSYRNDIDCRGNQRATARKYNIHRRQIQKWLQCEQNLRTTVEESAKNNSLESNVQKPRKKTESEDTTDLTLNQSATGFGRLGDAGRAKEVIEEHKVCCAEDSKLEAQNLKRVAQKLYPSVHGILSVQEEKVVYPNVGVDGQKFYRDDVGCAFTLPPSPTDTRDDNFNKVIRTDDRPLDLKSKVRSEILPEFLSSNVERPKTDEEPDKRSMGDKDEDRAEVASSNENIGGQKLSVSNKVLQCLVQKYMDGDVERREFHAGNTENDELLCSRASNRTESSCLMDVQEPKKSNSVPYLPASSAKRNLVEGKKTADVAPDLSLSGNAHNSDTCCKKLKTDCDSASKIFSRFDCSKSFSPKRKWMKESMQEMSEDVEHFLDASSLPIKQRVKMNLRSLPEATYTSDICNRPSGLSSNFTIERLCSTDSKESQSSECYRWRFPPAEAFSSHNVIPDLVSLHFKPEIRQVDVNAGLRSVSPNDNLLNIPVKEEKVSDIEDIDVDILSTTPVEKKSFDFSGYNFGKRRSFSVQFKLTVLDAFYNDKDCNKNQRATARKFNINRRQVQKWLSQESDLRSEGSVKNGKYLQRQRLGSDVREVEGCTRCPQHCSRKSAEVDGFDKTIEVNVKHCSDTECLSRRDNPKSRLADGMDFYSKNFFQTEDYCGGTIPGVAVNSVDISRRYRDISRVIFKELNDHILPNPSYLSYGVNRRKVAYSSYVISLCLIGKLIYLRIIGIELIQYIIYALFMMHYLST